MKKIKQILSCIGIFFGSFFSAFLLFFTIMNSLCKFEIVNATAAVIISASASVCISIGFVVMAIIYKCKKKAVKLVYLMGEIFPKLLLGYIVLAFFFGSVTNEVLWDEQKITNVLSILWTIFGLSITIFLVWNVIIVGYLKSKQPNEKDKSNFIERYQTLLDKRFLSQEIKTTFNAVVLMVINLFVLLIATAFIYLLNKPETLITQNITICAFYFCTHTLISLFMDILKPLIKDKKELLKNNSVTSNELVVAEVGASIQIFMENFVKNVNNMPQLDEDQKSKLIADMKQAFLDALKPSESKEDADVKELPQSVER